MRRKSMSVQSNFVLLVYVHGQGLCRLFFFRGHLCGPTTKRGVSLRLARQLTVKPFYCRPAHFVGGQDSPLDTCVHGYYLQVGGLCHLRQLPNTCCIAMVNAIFCHSLRHVVQRWSMPFRQLTIMLYADGHQCHPLTGLQ